MRYRSRQRLLAATVAVATLIAAPLARAETLTDTLIDAYRNSNLLEQNRAVLRAADEDAAIAVSSLRPVVAFVMQSGYGYAEISNPLGIAQVSETFSSTFALTAQMTLYDFGRSELAIEAARESVLATREALITIEQQVLLNAVSAFVQVRLAEEFVKLGENSLRVIGEELKASQDRFEVGEITRTDVAQAEARLAQARSNLSSAEGELQVAREAYRAATGHYPGRLSAPPPPPITAKTLDEARAVALRSHPSIRQGQRQVTVTEINIAASKANMLPTVGLQAELQTDNDGYQTNTFGFGIDQTIYAGGRLSAQLRRAMAVRDQAKAALQQTGVDIAQQVGNAWSRLEVAAVNIQATQQEIDAASIAFEGVKEEATLGARTTLDVLNAEQDLLSAQASRLRAEADRYVGVYQLLATMGLLTVEHLKLGIPTYDPAAYYNAVRNAPTSSPQSKRLNRIMKTIGQGN